MGVKVGGMRLTKMEMSRAAKETKHVVPFISRALYLLGDFSDFITVINPFLPGSHSGSQQKFILARRRILSIEGSSQILGMSRLKPDLELID